MRPQDLARQFVRSARQFVHLVPSSVNSNGRSGETYILVRRLPPGQQRHPGRSAAYQPRTGSRTSSSARLSPAPRSSSRTSVDFGKPRYCTGTIARLEGRCLIIIERSPRKDWFVHRVDVRDGVRRTRRLGYHLHPGGEQRSAPAAPGPCRVPRLVRHRDDVEKLRRLQAAVAALEGLSVGGAAVARRAPAPAWPSSPCAGAVPCPGEAQLGAPSC